MRPLEGASYLGALGYFFFSALVVWLDIALWVPMAKKQNLTVQEKRPSGFALTFLPQYLERF